MLNITGILEPLCTLFITFFSRSLMEIYSFILLLFFIIIYHDLQLMLFIKHVCKLDLEANLIVS